MPQQSAFEKLKKLLECSYGSKVNPWISSVEAENSLLDVAEEGELDHWVRYGFVKNAEAPHPLSNSIDGLRLLLNNLNRIGIRTVFIHKVFDNSGRMYRVFTDSELNKLIGVLRFPISKLAEPYPVRLKKLKTLIVDSYGRNQNPWISKHDVEKAVIDIAEGDGIPLVSVQMTYQRRASLNSERGKPIKGFGQFLKHLKATTAKAILTHKIKEEIGQEYQVFTDSDIMELIGILKFPLR